MEFKNDAFERLEKRGFVFQTTHLEETKKLLKEKPITFYIGIDPTADDLHIGHFFGLQMARILQDCGHKCIVLVGGATALIGDPTNKTDMRKMLSKEEVERNAKEISSIIKRFVRVDGDNPALIVDNAEWLKPISFIDFLRVFYTAHGFHFYEGAPKKNWLVYYPVERMLARRTDTLITINEEDFKLASERFPCHTARIHGVGVSDTRYHPVSADEVASLRTELGFSPEDEIILCVGELLPNKNQAMAIRAMVEVVKNRPHAILLLAGNGPERENLEALVKACGLEDHVRFLGYCTTLEKYQRISNLGVSCSYREGLGINLIEAMLSGNPVIGTHNRGHNELVSEGENGYLVKPNDAGSMAERMVDILSDPKKMTTMGQNGREFAEQYTYTQVKRELRAIYFS